MTVLQEILIWSQDRPAWQRDALRRLVVNGDIGKDDVRELADICKSFHGLTDPLEITPLKKQHVPDKIAGPPISIQSIYHHRGVNALAEQQTLQFGQGLTVVYGDNGAGKSGYTRIIKNACGARGQEKILGNVVSGTTPLSPIVSVKYLVGDEPNPREWTGVNGDEFISRISVFDTRCAAVYLTEKTEVKFRPFGLDLFDKLVQACKLVRTQLEADQQALGSSSITAIQPMVSEGTIAARFLEKLSSLTKPESVRAIVHLSDEETARLAFLEKALLDLQVNDPEKLIKQLILRLNRVNSLARHLSEVESALSDEAVTELFNVRKEGTRKAEEAKRLREATFPADVLPGTGTEAWSTLWETARSYSESVLTISPSLKM